MVFHFSSLWQTGKEGRDHIHDGASRAAAKTQETAGAAKENTQAAAHKANQAAKDVIAPTESKTTFQVINC